MKQIFRIVSKFEEHGTILMTEEGKCQEDQEHEGQMRTLIK